MKSTFYCKYGKRFFDIVFSGFALLLLLPIIIIIGIIVRLKLGSPVIFSQNRPGLNEKVFKMYKFRTMTNQTDKLGELMPDEVRLTKFGKLLRASSLDELPELWNILKGDMSIVGPRPQLVKDLYFMSSTEKKRQTILPGLTGFAQVNGRNAISWEEKFKYDLIYMENITFFNDLKIVLLTIGKVFKREDISANGMETAEDLGDYLLKVNKISQEEYDKILGEISND